MEPNEEKTIREPVMEEQPRKPYNTPQLAIHGSVEAITQAGAISVKDVSLGGSTLL